MRKIPAALLSLALTASLTGPAAAAPRQQANSSLPELDGHWSQAAFERWHGYGIVEGDVRGMRPDDAITAGEFAALLCRAMGYTDTVDNPYADLKGDEWYAPYILRLTAAGILEGDGVNCNPNAPMDRQRAAVLFARAMGIRPTENPDLSGFVDGHEAADWAAGWLDALAQAGILHGVGGDLLALDREITRGSIVTLLNNAVAEYVHTSGATVTGDVDGILLVAAGGATVQNAQVDGAVILAPKAVSPARSGEAALTVENSTLKSDLLVQAHGAQVDLSDTQVEGEAVLSGDRASLSLGGSTQVAALTAEGADGSVAVGKDAAVGDLTAKSNLAVDNQGTIDRADIQAGGVVIDGNRPGSLTVADGVTPPTDGAGETLPGTDDETGGENDNNGGSGGSGGGSGSGGSGGGSGSGGSGGGSGSGSGSEEETPGQGTGLNVVGVRPVDQDSPETPLPAVTAQATQEEGHVKVALSTEEIVPIHQSEGAGKGAWVGVAFAAPEGYEEETFRYAFGTQASAEAGSTASLTEDPAIGEGKYAVFFINASALTPKTHITLQWGEEAEAIQYVVDLSGVKTPAAVLEGVSVSTHEMPSGVDSTAEGLSFDGSTALVQNEGSGELTYSQVASMGGGGEYTVYYSVPQALGDGTLQFDKIARSVNGGAWNTWAMPSSTEASSGSGWWTKDGSNYYFKWGAVFAQQAEDIWQMKDGGVFEYTLAFLESEGGQDNVVATCTFTIDLSGYTIVPDEEL